MTDVSPPVPVRLWEQVLTLLPNAEETLFLRACLHSGDVGRDAWRRWQHAARRDDTTLRHSLSSFNLFLPLLLWNLRRNQSDVAEWLVTYLRFAHMTEALRWEKYREICESALAALREAEIPALALKAAALSESVYPLPMLRHAADIDLLLQAPDLARASALLTRLSWRQAPPPFPASSYQLPAFIHPSGLPLELHYRLLMPYYTLPYDRLWARSERAMTAGLEVGVLSAADNLLHVCAHAMLGGRILHWVPDAWLLIHRHATFDWATLLSTAVAARLGLPVYVALHYLESQMGAPIPPETLAELRTAAIRTDFRGRCATRLAARPWPHGSARQIWAQPGSRWRRVVVLWRRAFPSPLEFALRYDLRWWQLPVRYVQRFARHARQSVLRRRASPGEHPVSGVPSRARGSPT